MNPGDIIATRQGGWLLIYDGVADGLDTGHVVDPKGRAFPSQYVAAIAARGYWESVTPTTKSVIVIKHERHDQKTHGRGRSIANVPGGAGSTRPASADDIARIQSEHGYKVPTHWVEAHVPTDSTSGLVVKGVDAKGKTHYVYSASHVDSQSAIKFARVKEMNEAMPKLDSALARDLHPDRMNPDAIAVGIMRHTGCRVGDESAVRGRLVRDATYGATTLRAKHVTVNPSGSVTLDFVGKDGVRQKLLIKDPVLAAAITKQKGDKKGNDRIFPDSVNNNSTMKYLRDATGLPHAKNHDLRTHMANSVALASKGTRKPKTRKEFREKRKAIGEKVAKQLGNTPAVALGTYINPIVFADWMQPGWE